MKELKDLNPLDHAKHDHPKHTVGAIFESKEEAKQALGALHKARFLKSWFGVTSLATDSHGEQTLTAEPASHTFLSQDAKGLVDALVAHGIDGSTARVMESEIEPGNALVTVETGDRDPAEAIDILERFGGRTESSGMPDAPRAERQMPGDAPDTVQGMYDELDELPVWEEEVFYTRTPVGTRR